MRASAASDKERHAGSHDYHKHDACLCTHQTCSCCSEWVETWVEGGLGQAFQVWRHQIGVQCGCVAQRALLGVHLLVQMLLHAAAPSPSAQPTSMRSDVSTIQQGTRVRSSVQPPGHSIAGDTEHPRHCPTKSPSAVTS